MNADQPHFRFNPSAYCENRSLTASTDQCDVCSRPCGWKYTGNVYAVQRPIVCARCIANGALGSFLADQHFALHDIELDGAGPVLAQELRQRTPGVACFNPFQWPVIDGRPLAFVGYGPDPGVVDSLEAKAAIAAAYSELGWDDVEPNPSDPYALVFRTIDGADYRAVIDLD